MSEEIKMTERESLELITSMINKAKNNFSEKGFLYLLWGWIILICCITQFVAGYLFNYANAYYVWFLPWVVVIFQMIYLNKKKKSQRTKTYTEEINAWVWLVFFICMVLMIFICVRFKKYEMINPLLLILYGMPTFLSGIIIKFKPLMIGGICCWILAFMASFIAYKYQLLLISTAVIAAWIIPGYLLQIKYKKEKLREGNY